ncbi:MAG TPA: ATP-binding protein [Trichocoleus sp.]
MTLRSRLVVLVLLAVIPALGLVLQTASTQRRTAGQEAQESLLRIAKSTAINQRQAVEGARQLLLVLSQLPEIRNPDIGKCNQLLHNLQIQYQAYEGFAVFDAEGKTLCSAPVVSNLVNVADLTYFRRARESHTFAIGEYQSDRITGQPTINLAYPILDETNQVDGVVMAALDLSWLNRLAAEPRLPPGMVLMVTDRNGTILSHYPDPEPWKGKRLPEAPSSEVVLAEQGGIVEARGADGVERLYAFTTMGSNATGQDIHVKVSIPKSLAFASANRILVKNLVGLGAVAGLALTAAWVGSDVFLIRKVQSLVATTKQLQAGDLEARTELTHEAGELGQLARSFDDMAAAIQQRELAIAALNQDLQTLFHVVPIGILLTQDLSFKDIKSNPAFAQILGISKEENASYTPSNNATQPGYKLVRNGQELKPDEFPLREAAVRGITLEGIEVDILRQDGSLSNLFGYAAPLLDDRGKPRGAVAAFLDITERKQAEAERENLLTRMETGLRQLEAVLNSMAEGLIITDASGKIIVFNPVALDLYQYASLDEVVHPSHSLPEIFEMRDLQGTLIPPGQWPICRALSGETFANCELLVYRRDTGKTWIGSYTGTPVYNSERQIILAVVTMRDVTAQRQAQIDLARSLQAEQTAREHAETANRLKDEFLAVLSHELRSPLNPILGWTKLLRSRPFDPQTTDRALETIERNAQLQAQLIEDLLDVSRILQGKIALNLTDVNLASVIEAALETVRLTADAKSVALQTQIHDGVGQVKGDAARLQQIVWNLVSNAVKFTPQGGVIDVRLQRSGAYAQIQVKDTGKGIKPEFLPHLFEYFRQEDSTTTRKFGGLGLGLAIVRHITEIHGGTVWAESPGEGLGSTFTVELPLLPYSPAAPEQPKPNWKAVSLAGLHILVVDDEMDIRDVVAFVLEQAGARVRMAASATEALSLLKQDLPDVLVCDIGMPEQDGYSLIRQVRNLATPQGEKIAAIALTAYAGVLNEQKALAAGFQRHIAKPVAPDALIQAVAEVARI